MKQRLARLVRKELPVYVGFGRNPTARFLIFAQGRTGTWLLHSLLNAHPQIACAKEILQKPVLFPLRYVNQHGRGQLKPIFGCHVQINQLLTAQPINPAAFLDGLYNAGWSILYLRRRNMLRQSISTMIANQRREWHTQQVNRIAGERFYIDGPQLCQWLERRVHHGALERELLANLPHLELVYEDNLQESAEHQVTMNRVFDFLQVESAPVSAGVERLSPKHLPDYVANYAELQDLLRGTRYEEYLT